MPEAVIVATARSPIGRAFKGSLVDVRPDDLAAQMVEAVAGQGARSCRSDEIEDLMLGCGLPGGEQGFNMARVVALLAGIPQVPGTTVNRYCSSSLQTIRMAAHAIRAGEGDAFLAAGVETVSRFVQGQLRQPARHHQPPLRRGRGPLGRAGPGGRGALEPSRPACPTSTSPWATRPRTWPSTATSRATRWTPTPCRASRTRPGRSSVASSSRTSRRSRCPTARS